MAVVCDIGYIPGKAEVHAMRQKVCDYLERDDVWQAYGYEGIEEVPECRESGHRYKRCVP
jgi:hypothetical protein